MKPLLETSPVAVAALLASVLAACGGGGGGGASLPDSTPPTIIATARVGPEAVVLSAAVSDDVAVTQVDFLIDGGTTRATASDSQGRTSFSVDIPLARFGAGSHSMVAQARDAAGNVAEADAVHFDVGGTTPASPIHITASSTQDGGNVTFTVDIQSDAQLSLTNFFVDGEFLGGRADDQRHYSFSRLLPAGTHHLLVDVTDVSGRSAQAEVTVEV